MQVEIILSGVLSKMALSTLKFEEGHLSEPIPVPLAQDLVARLRDQFPDVEWMPAQDDPELAWVVSQKMGEKQRLERTRESALLEKHAAALTLQDPDGRALAAAMRGGEWGAQADGSFLRRGRDLGSGEEWAELHAPGKQGPLARASWRFWQSAATICSGTLLTADQARAVRQEQRAANRKANEAYMRHLDAAELALASGLSLPCHAGQEGGTVLVAGEHRVSLPGVLRRLGLDATYEGGLWPRATQSSYRLPPIALAKCEPDQDVPRRRDRNTAWRASVAATVLLVSGLAHAAAPPFEIPSMHGRGGEDLRAVYLESMDLQDIYLSNIEMRATPRERGCVWAEFGAAFVSTALKIQYPEIELAPLAYEASHGRDRFAREISLTATDRQRHEELEQAGTVFEQYMRQFCIGIGAARYGRLHQMLIEHRTRWVEDVERSAQWQRVIQAIGRASACDGFTGLCGDSSLREVPGKLLFEAALMMAAGFLVGPLAPAQMPIRWTLSGGILRAAGGTL